MPRVRVLFEPNETTEPAVRAAQQERLQQGAGRGLTTEGRLCGCKSSWAIAWKTNPRCGQAGRVAGEHRRCSLC